MSNSLLEMAAFLYAVRFDATIYFCLSRAMVSFKARGESTNAFIYRAVKETIARDKQK